MPDNAALSEAQLLEATIPPSPIVQQWRELQTFLYNPKDGTVMGRTGWEWLQVIAFYLAFYGFLAAFFAAALHLFMMTLDPRQPRWQRDSGQIGTTPGMGFRPRPPDPESQLLWINSTAKQMYIDQLKTFLAPYTNQATNNGPLLDCSPMSLTPNTTVTQPDDTHSDYVCKFDMSLLGACAEKYDFGYNTNQPCVLLKINKIYGWFPNVMTPVPSEVTAFQQSIQLISPPDSQSIPVTCAGETELDSALLGPLAMYPASLPQSFFPYQGQANYLSPVVMLQFLDLPRDVIVNVRCKFWVPDVVHDAAKGWATVGLQIMLNSE
ncbi:sodium/potassium-transporting ATPase subunit beta-2-like [Paramacrobiotus metropolitanus]|uniref:sodium/potassium-transporting ATPase subunit beta-2-like n=1 Tax=Paramacrobiotus metropolitanus TaxID=2943436 RepID=UPI002446320F|nr:sodium/potassium-transporting ATPase subunit beta-2-like [Paramacrobiotus metropolitanus]